MFSLITEFSLITVPSDIQTFLPIIEYAPISTLSAIFADGSIIADSCRFENVVMMGADNYELVNSQKMHVGVGTHSKIENAIIDKNACIGKYVQLSTDGVEDGWSDDGENIYGTSPPVFE